MYFNNQISRRHFNKVLCFKKYELRNSLVYSGERNGNLLQYSCLENPMDRGAWKATVHGAAKNRIQLSDFPYSGPNEMGFPDGSRDLGSIPGSGRFPWRRKWQPTPVLLPGKFHGQRSLVCYSPWGHKESDTTEHTHTHTQSSSSKRRRSQGKQLT